MRGTSSDPSPPPGQGPVVASYRGTRRKSLQVATSVTLIIVFITCIRRDFSWMRFWQIWPILISITLVCYLISRKVEHCCAGVEWLGRGSRWVRTYELTSAQCFPRRTEFDLELTDSRGRSLSIELSVLTANPTVWMCVREGIVESITSGAAESNPIMRKILNDSSPHNLR
jgi:hypothetical protein